MDLGLQMLIKCIFELLVGLGADLNSGMCVCEYEVPKSNPAFIPSEALEFWRYYASGLPVLVLRDSRNDQKSDAVYYTCREVWGFRPRANGSPLYGGQGVVRTSRRRNRCTMTFCANVRFPPLKKKEGKKVIDGLVFFGQTHLRSVRCWRLGAGDNSGEGFNV